MVYNLHVLCTGEIKGENKIYFGDMWKDLSERLLVQ